MHTERCRDMDISFSREPDNTFIVRLGGNWNIVDGLPSSEQLQKQIGSTPFPERVAFDTRELGAWDSSLLTFLIKLTNFCRGKSVPISYQGLPEGVARLIDLASAVPEKEDARKESGRAPFLSRVGETTLEAVKSAGEVPASGDLSARTGVASKQENPEEMMRVLDEMAEALRRREEQLRVSEAKYRLLVEQIPAVTYTAVLDVQSTTTYISPQIESLLGYRQSEWLTDPNLWLNSICLEDRPRVLEALAQTQATGKPLDCEYRMIRSSGSLVWVRDEAVVVRDGDHQSPYLHGIMRDITERKDFEHSLEQLNRSLRKTVEGTILAMSFTVESRDPYTAGHQKRVSDIALAIAENMDLSREEMEGIRVGGLIHDMGKIAVPAEILSKPGRLNEHEFALIKDHAQTGFDILKSIELPWPVAQIAYQHHERLDGSGYPRNLKGDEIIMEARIIAVADVIEAMASHRPYRPALGLDKALEEIHINRGVLFDAEAVDACLKLFKEKNYTLEI